MRKFLIKHPIITEKASQISALGKYIFKVDAAANKPEVKKALKEIYKVDVVDVQIINVKPKPRQMGRYRGTKSGYKKAIVTLKAGQKLDVLPH